jgi:hypothetical protein
VVHEFAQLVHFFVQGFEDRVFGEELVQPQPLPLVETLGSLAQGGEVAAVMLEVGRQLARQLHEVVLDDPHHMEAVGHDAGVGKVAPDQAAVGAG